MGKYLIFVVLVFLFFSTYGFSFAANVSSQLDNSSLSENVLINNSSSSVYESSIDNNSDNSHEVNSVYVGDNIPSHDNSTAHDDIKLTDNITYVDSSKYSNKTDYVDALVKEALAEKIQNERTWIVLLHYKKTMFKPHIHSLVDDPKFFLSKVGQKDPAAELEATIRGLFSDTLSVGDDDNHPFCRFPARKEWLISRLHIDESRLPKKHCVKFEKIIKEMDPQSVTLVFPFMYINSPASMFGHTLLRLNNNYNNVLLSHGITYTADMPKGVNALVFSIKGIFGAYTGHFRIKPYYELLFDYSNVDKRDIWEYDLNFTHKETLTLFYHLWELADVYSYYYFFDENCSYNLLFLLEAARPSLKLTTSIFWEAPSDTVKRVFKNKLVTNIHYVPSHVSLINGMSNLVPYASLSLATKVGMNKAKPSAITGSNLSEKVKVAMLDLAIETMRYNFIGHPANNQIFQNYKKQSMALLMERSKYHVKSDYKVKEPVSPHLGHGISSVTLGGGFTNNQFYTTVGFRLAFHSLYDMDNGYIPNSQTVVGDINLNWNTVNGDVYVKDATFLSVGAYVPITRIFKPISWKVDFAAETKDFKDGKKFVPYLNGAVGATFKLFDQVYVWFLGDLNLSFSNGYKNIVGVGLGGHTGLSYEFKWGKIIGEGYYRNYVANGLGQEMGVSGAYIFPVTQNNTITAKFERNASWGVYTTNISLAWRFYF